MKIFKPTFLKKKIELLKTFGVGIINISSKVNFIEKGKNSGLNEYLKINQNG